MTAIGRRHPLGVGARTTVALLAVLALASVVAVTAPTRLRPAVSPRVVIDARGKSVAIPLPFRGAAMLFPPSIDDYLVVTRRPESLAAVQALNRSVIDEG